MQYAMSGNEFRHTPPHPEAGIKDGGALRLPRIGAVPGRHRSVFRIHLPRGVSMSRPYSSSDVFLASICVVFLPALHAQVERASIIGKITDSTGAAMAAVEVTVTNESTNT
jgi:hypothetical protein